MTRFSCGRVGMNLPYGLRVIEHTLFVRVATRTDINDTQQHGVSVAARGGGFRGELMGIAGNYQASPDAFRERGYSGYVEYAPVSRWAFGVSSLITHAADDVFLRAATTRQAHGVMLRGSPTESLAILGEADLTVLSPSGQPTWTGVATMLQADLEPWQGLHFIGTGETWATGQPGTAPPGVGGRAWIGFSSSTSTGDSITFTRVWCRAPCAFRWTRSSPDPCVPMSMREPFSAARMGLAVAVTLALTAGSPAVHAKEQFPGEIAGDLGLDYTPPCRLCHIQGTTGAGSYRRTVRDLHVGARHDRDRQLVAARLGRPAR